ncbi:helix-turn-helix domain-containing protein [Enterococcus songbeiensis]|uniref:helix-turn-helix domain-containing protein n=1 Tax=Enterococcus songbeiensis TaxID=2559927 RepID=UPI0010F67DF9|nr:helix-turn-helix domain-containing protein [Enterococcus songbeiensis]
MEVLLEKNLLRHYQIIKFLVYRNWENISTISKFTKISESTIRKSIGDINRYITPAKLESSKQLGVRLVLKPNQNPFFLFSSLYKQSARFSILEEIFLSKHDNLTALSDHLFLSISTLKRKIGTINELLAPLDFQIDCTYMDIVGDERKICWFYYCYLIEKYGLIEKVTSEKDIEIMDRIMQEFIDFYPSLKTSARQTYSYVNRFRTMLFINFIRIRRGHLLPSQSHNDLKHGFSFSQDLTQKICQHYHIDLTPKTLYRLFYIFFNEKYAWSMTDLNDKCTSNKGVQSLRSAIAKTLDTIIDSEDLILSNKEELILYLYNATTYIWGPAKILYNLDEEFFIDLNNYYDGFTQRIRPMVICHFLNKNLPIFIDDSVISRLLFMIVTSWNSLSDQLEKKCPTIRTGLFFNTSYEHCNFLKEDLMYHLKTRVDVNLIDATTLSSVKAEMSNYDLLITNLSSLFVPDCIVISIHSNPTPRDFEHILIAYNKIVNNKRDFDLSVVQKKNSIYKY